MCMPLKKIFKKLHNESGMSLFIATLVIVAVGLTGLKVVDLSAKESTNSSSDMLSRVAEASAQSGIETALFDLENGLDPAKSFDLDTASVTVTTDPQNNLVTVQGLVPNGILGDVKRVYQVNADFSKDNMELLVDEAVIEDDTIDGLTLQKTDNGKTDILSSVTLSWNQSDCATGITCDASDDHSDASCQDIPGSYEPYRDPNHNNKILICHKGDTLSVSENAWDHQGHRCHAEDYLGACVSDGISEEPQANPSCDADHLSEDALEDLNACTVTTAGNTWNRLVLQGTTVFAAGSIPDGDAVAKRSGQEAQILNVNLSSAGTYSIDEIRFANAIADGTWFTMRLTFADQSYIEKQFQVFTSGAIVEEEGAAVVQGADGDFEEVAGEVIISDQDNYALTVGVLAVEITCGSRGVYVPVTIDIAKNGTYSTAFGGESVSVGEEDTSSNLLTENAYKIRATAALKSCKDYSATVESTSNMVYSLVDGDAVPETWSGFGGQQTVRQVLAGYIDADTGQIQLASNQVIMLFEFGATTNSSSADYQDLVLLVTVDRM